MRPIIFLIIISFFLVSPTQLKAQAERHDKGVFKPYKNEFFEKIKESIKKFNTPEKKEKEYFKMDFTGLDLPKSIDEFTKYWYNPPISQGNTGTCWDFSTTSFFESEVYRIYKKEIKLSEMYTAYWEYVEKARRYIRERGNSEFGQGSEANAVPRIWKIYGIVPEEVYTGLKPGQEFHDHSKMFAEMKSYLNGLKESNAWNEDEALATIKSIMNHYIGEPPAEFTVDGKTYTPKQYLKDVVKLNLDDYVDILSLKAKPYYEQVEYKVPDNWWHSDVYYNIPLDDFMNVIKKAIRNGYTLAIGGDVSEAGYDAEYEVAMIPSFDIPSDYIDEDSRQFRFSNHSTTDDHGIHLVGYMTKNGKDWYLIKDSGSGSRNGNNKGYYFYQEDYVKLKIMDFMVHKDVVKDLLKKFNR